VADPEIRADGRTKKGMYNPILKRAENLSDICGAGGKPTLSGKTLHGMGL